MPPEVCVLDEIVMWVERADLCNHDLYPAASRDFQRGNEIGVVGCDNDPVNAAIECQGRDVDADAHIDAFLFKSQFVVFRSRRAELSLSQLTQVGFRKDPAAWVSLSASKRDEILLSESIEKGVSRFGYGALRVRDALFCDRMPLHASVRAGIIVKNSPYLFGLKISQAKSMLVYFSGGRSALQLQVMAQRNREELAINEDC